ncbi:hypothetical protein BLNAU_10919 [Blattamonas nauphoetae]|uniref:Uncharacterized protein n=1 Tax=Blattamonas nauphoetae TaxID=2049346 RepID=A0ABQ9XSK5_9EUKA|nr:hypothetical protein BLNAU_10919 [Blattamonas nauphoetae]
MAFASTYLSNKGALGKLWKAGTESGTLSRSSISDVNIVSVVQLITSGDYLNPKNRPTYGIQVRLSAQLLYGIVRVYSRKLVLLQDDLNTLFTRISVKSSEQTKQKKTVQFSIPSQTEDNARDLSIFDFGLSVAPRIQLDQSLLDQNPFFSKQTHTTTDKSKITLPQPPRVDLPLDIPDFARDFFADASDDLLEDFNNIQFEDLLGHLEGNILIVDDETHQEDRQGTPGHTILLPLPHGIYTPTPRSRTHLSTPALPTTPSLPPLQQVEQALPVVDDDDWMDNEAIEPPISEFGERGKHEEMLRDDSSQISLDQDNHSLFSQSNLLKVAESKPPKPKKQIQTRLIRYVHYPEESSQAEEETIPQRKRPQMDPLERQQRAELRKLEEERKIRHERMQTRLRLAYQPTKEMLRKLLDPNPVIDSVEFQQGLEDTSSIVQNELRELDWDEMRERIAQFEENEDRSEMGDELQVLSDDQRILLTVLEKRKRALRLENRRRMQSASKAAEGGRSGNEIHSDGLSLSGHHRPAPPLSDFDQTPRKIPRLEGHNENDPFAQQHEEGLVFDEWAGDENEWNPPETALGARSDIHIPVGIPAFSLEDHGMGERLADREERVYASVTPGQNQKLINWAEEVFDKETKNGPEVPFPAFIPQGGGRREKSQAFMSMLKLHAAGYLHLKQERPYGDITATRVTEPLN